MKKRESKVVLEFSQDEIAQLKKMAKFCMKIRNDDIIAIDYGSFLDEIEKEVEKINENFIIKLLVL
jgi:hypothetical protein